MSKKLKFVENIRRKFVEKIRRKKIHTIGRYTYHRYAYHNNGDNLGSKNLVRSHATHAIGELKKGDILLGFFQIVIKVSFINMSKNKSKKKIVSSSVSTFLLCGKNASLVLDVAVGDPKH